MMMQKLNTALIQMNISIGKPEHNFEEVSQWLNQAVTAPVKPDVIVLPEMWNTGYALEEIHLLADENGEQTKSLISNFCKQHNVNVVAGSIAEKRNGDIRNTSYIFNREGKLTGAYSKIHLFRLMDEEKYLTAGEAQGGFQLEQIPSGVMICYDIRFPELFRTMALQGTKLMFIPAEWPKPRLHHWRTLLMARAIENQMYVVSCNRMGTSGSTEFFGHSMIIDPWGEVIAEAGEEEGILTAEIDLDLVDDVRSRIPIFEDRRPAIYKLDR
jgi:omega-amidase